MLRRMMMAAVMASVLAVVMSGAAGAAPRKISATRAFESGSRPQVTGYSYNYAVQLLRLWKSGYRYYKS